MAKWLKTNIYNFLFSGLSNNQLKIIAMISMFIDHLGLQIFPTESIYRIIGRIALPIFAYMIAEGCKYTRKRWLYLVKILSLGLICQVVYFIVDNGSLYQGILITFSLSISIIFTVDKFINTKRIITKICMSFILAILGFISIGLPIIFKNQGFIIDYGIIGILMPVLIYYSKGKANKLRVLFMLIAFRGLFKGGIEHFNFLALPFLALYNEKRGKLKMKYAFYIFYPLHLVFIYAIDILLYYLK